ncbi:MAG: aminoacyl-tRNA hydrolase [Steroidobacteraceae bacterium]|nr:aminoacyl-tRNA hydrolase [Steroidobacteraceae bacterium]MDW8260013.1 aminoacyl-tRNA hydrolase [Gammaproteobacteria bacterium]
MAGLPLRLIVGLGNPGERYARTRHNAGFWFVDELARRFGGHWRDETRYPGTLARVRVGDADLWLFKPGAYMNCSGGPVQNVAAFYRIAPREILVAHDELDLPTATLRLKEGGGHAGHNGVRDCIAAIGPDFWRLRIGIGHPGEKSEVVDYALSVPTRDEVALLRRAIERAADIVPILLVDGAQHAMQRLHTANGTPGDL